MASRVIMVTGDLLAGSQAQGAANAAGVELVTAGPAKLPALLEESAPVLVLFDLSLGSDKLGEKVRDIRDRHPGTAIAAFGPHVQEKRLQAARSAGCDVVMSRGQFHRGAAALFAHYASDAGPPDSDGSGADVSE